MYSPMGTKTFGHNSQPDVALKCHLNRAGKMFANDLDSKQQRKINDDSPTRGGVSKAEMNKQKIGEWHCYEQRIDLCYSK